MAAADEVVAHEEVVADAVLHEVVAQEEVVAHEDVVAHEKVVAHEEVADEVVAHEEVVAAAVMHEVPSHEFPARSPMLWPAPASSPGSDASTSYCRKLSRSARARAPSVPPGSETRKHRCASELLRALCASEPSDSCALCVSALQHLGPRGLLASGPSPLDSKPSLRVRDKISLGSHSPSPRTSLGSCSAEPLTSLCSRSALNL